MQLLRDNLKVSIHVTGYSLYRNSSFFEFLQLWTSEESDFDNTNELEEQ
jgi:hypothetical protein